MFKKAGFEMVTDTWTVKKTESEVRKALMLRSAYSLSWLLLFFLILLVSSASAMEIKGKVVEVKGSRAKIAYESDLVPREGDEVQIGQDLSGMFIPVEGDWKIVKITRDFAWAESKSADTGTPDAGYLAIIQSENPKKRSDLDSLKKRKKEKVIGTGIADAEKYYQKGKALYKDKQYKEAVKWFRKAAEQGYAKAQSNLAHMYEYGKGIEKDYQEALRLMRLAAEQGLARAEAQVGSMFERGKGLEKDYREAAKWYRLAAEQGDIYAQTNLGLLYEYGRGLEKDPREAAKWYRLAAEKGLAVAQSNLAKAYYYGRGVNKDRSEAARWFKKSADQGFEKAIYYLAWMYDHGEGGLPRDPDKAVRFYREAARKGHKSSQDELKKKNVQW
jgi:TPR repeat protein